jgi:hypothetical protein
MGTATRRNVAARFRPTTSSAGAGTPTSVVRAGASQPRRRRAPRWSAGQRGDATSRRSPLRDGPHDVLWARTPWSGRRTRHAGTPSYGPKTPDKTPHKTSCGPKTPDKTPHTTAHKTSCAKKTSHKTLDKDASQDGAQDALGAPSDRNLPSPRGAPPMSIPFDAVVWAQTSPHVASHVAPHGHTSPRTSSCGKKTGSPGIGVGGSGRLRG